MDKAKILLVDGNQSAREALHGVIEETGIMEVCASVSGGTEALGYLREHTPDVMVMDFLLPGLDGESLLAAIRAEGLAPKMHVIVATGFARDESVLTALRLGAAHFLIKPFSPAILIKRIETCLAESGATPIAEPPALPPLDDKITTLFLTIGVPAHIKGYHYLREGVRLAVLHPTMMDHITKQLYPAIAKRFDTEPGKVERAIRHAIDVVWTRGRVENINRAFGIQIYTGKVRPTNSEFIALIADRLLVRRVG